MSSGIRAALLATAVVAACGGRTTSTGLTAAEARLGPDDPVTQHMCAIMIDRVFDTVQEQIPQDAYGSSGHGTDSIRLRQRIERDRARLKEPGELAWCASQFHRRDYDCAMRASTEAIKACLPGIVWVSE